MIFSKYHTTLVWQIPAEWKLANVVSVHKKGTKSKSSVENYRPIMAGGYMSCSWRN